MNNLSNFASDETNQEKLTSLLEEMLSQTFHYPARIVLRSSVQMQQVITEAPDDWHSRTDLRRNIAFLKEPVTASEALPHIEPKECIDMITTGDAVLYFSTVLSGVTQSALGKLVSKKIYQHMTIRNYQTTKKLFALMQQETSPSDVALQHGRDSITRISY